MRTSLLPFCISLVLGGLVYAQGIRPPKLTDQVVSQVVTRILRYEIKPASRPRIVYLSGTSFIVRDEDTPLFPIPIQPKWLPRIKNIEFKVYGEGEANEQGYFFDCIEKVNGRFFIAVGYGDLGLGGGEGKIWGFIVKKNRVRLWLKPNEGFAWASDAAQ